MELLLNLLQLPSAWLMVIGIIAVIVVIKVIRSVIGAVVGLALIALSLYRGPTNKKRKTYAKQISTLIKPSFPTLRKFGLLFID